MGTKPRAAAPQRAVEDRNARLAASLSGTNLERAGEYNQRVVLQAIRVSGETTRAELAEVTGLTAPTIANITRRLLDSGLLLDAGRRHGGRGQPAVRIAINPSGCFSIGVNVDRDHITVLTLDLAGQVRSRTLREFAFPMPDQVRAFVREEVGRVLAAGTIEASRVAGIGVAIPDGLARVDLPHRPADYGAWDDVDVTALLGDILPVAVHTDNDAAAAAIGELQFGHGLGERSFFYVLISAGLGGGLVVDGSYVRGANGRSGELGFLPLDGAHGGMLERVASLSALRDRLEQGGFPDLDLDQLASAPTDAHAIVDQWLDDAAEALAWPLLAINCLIDPGAILVGGRLPELLMERLVLCLQRVAARYAHTTPSVTPIRRAMLSADAPAIGAAILPFNDLILPSQASLMKVA